MTLVAGPTNSGCSGNGIQPSQRMEIMNQVRPYMAKDCRISIWISLIREANMVSKFEIFLVSSRNR